MEKVWAVLSGTLLVALATGQAVRAETQGRLSLSQASFISPDYTLTNKKDYSLFGGGLDTLSGIRNEKEIDDNLHAQVRGMVAPGASVLNFLNVSQLYWKQNVLSVGRKKILWSQLDENFNLGSFQPQFKWNPLAWESQGLTGIFVHFEETAASFPWGVTLFGSSLFIPNQGAGYEVKNGTFESTNPYFRTPPTTAVYNDQEFPVAYVIHKPETQDVVFRQSFAGRAFIGDFERSAFLQLAYASKPMNELNLGFQGYAQALGNEGGQVKVEILPVVSNHHLISGDLHYSAQYARVGVSALYESPKEPAFEEPWTYAKYSDSTLISPFLEFKFKKTEIGFAALSVDGGNSIPVGAEANQANAFIPQRYPFRNAGQISVKTQYRLKRNQNLAVASKYLRGETGEFDLWNTQVSYQWHKQWAASLTNQMIAVEKNAKGSRTAFSPYVNNDLIAVGVSYVF